MKKTLEPGDVPLLRDLSNSPLMSSNTCLRSRRGALSIYILKRALATLVLVSVGIIIGAYLNRYGYILEDIKVNVVVQVSNETYQMRRGLKGNIDGEAPKSDGELKFVNVVEESGNTHVYRVPNIVHFVWFGEKKEMTFIQYTSILSAHKIQRPEVLMLHCDHLPVGKWWTKLWSEVPIKIVHTEPPESIHGQKILHRYHQGDIAKIEILLRYGGIYLDYDVIVLSSMDPLRKFPATLGKEKPPKLIAGIIVAEKDSLFMKIWHESYRNNYRPLDWDYNCARVTYKLALAKPDLVHIEPRKLTTPDWQDRHKLFNGIINWRDLYCIHIMMHLNWSEYTPDNIRPMNNTLGEILRFIYYGSPKLLK